jgi:hypothetical protein
LLHCFIQKDKSALNPYEETPVGMSFHPCIDVDMTAAAATTLQDVRLQLATEEEQNLTLGDSL